MLVDGDIAVRYDLDAKQNDIFSWSFISQEADGPQNSSKDSNWT